MSYEEIHRLLDKFSVMSNLNDNGGRVDIETFSKYMDVPISDTLRELFDMYDRVIITVSAFITYNHDANGYFSSNDLLSPVFAVGFLT